MQSTLCPSCKQPIDAESEQCHFCGSLIDSLPSFLKGKRGKQKLFAVSVAIITAFVLLSLGTTILAGALSSDLLFSSLIHIGFLTLILFFIYKGHWWARIILLIILTGASLITCLFLTSLIFKPWSSSLYPLIMASALTLFCSSGLALFKSGDIKTFLESQMGKNKSAV